MIAATSTSTPTSAPALAPTAAPPASAPPMAANDPLALAVGATPTPGVATAAKPSSSFEAMLAALAPQGREATTQQPGSVKAALGEGAGDDGATGTAEGDDLAGDVTADGPLLTALAAGISLPAIQTQLAARTPLRSASSAATRTAAPAAVAATPDAPAPAPATLAQPDANAAATAAAQPAPAFDIEAMFPGLTARLDGAAGAKGARGKPATAPIAGATDASAPALASAPPAARTATLAAAPAEAEAKHAAAPALDAIAVTPAAPQPSASPVHAPAEAPAAPVASGTPAPDGVQAQLHVAQDGAWLDRLARDIAQSADRDAKLRFQLNPEHLGTLKVELANGADGAQVRFTADTEAARSLLADQQPRLLAEARAQGMRIADARIDLASQSGAQTAAGQSFQQQGQSGQRVAWSPLPTTSTTITPAETAAIPPASGERYA